MRIERVRKLFITSYILDEFSCGKVQISFLRQQQKNIEVLSVTCYCFLHTPGQRLEVMWKNRASMEKALRQRFATKSD